MKMQTRTKEQLTNELEKMRQRVAELEKVDAERKRAEKALRESEEKYRTVLETIEEAYYEVDLAGNFTFFNDPLCRILGYPPDELMGMNSRQYLDDETAKAVYETFNRVYRTGEPDRAFGWQAISKDGIKSFVEASISLMHRPSGEPVGFRGIIRDITERKQAEEALRKSEEQYRLLAENVTDVIWTMDRNLQFTYISPSVTRQRGYSVDEAMALGMEKTWTPASLEVATKVILEGLSAEMKGGKDLSRSWTVELEMYCKDGSTIWTEMEATFLRDPDGQPVGILGVARDITERKKAEEALQQREQDYLALLETTFEGIVVVDAETLKVVYGNRRASKMFGFDPILKDGVGVNILDLVHPEDIGVVIKGFTEDVHQEERRQKYEVRAKTKDGREIWITALGTRTEFQGRLAVLLSTIDITERKRVEEELRESEEKYRLLIDNLNEPLTVYDSNGRILLMNVASAKNLGSMPEDVVGKSLYDFFPDTAEVFVERARRIFESGVGLEFEHEIPFHSGNRWFYSNIQPVKDTSGKVISVQNISYDITERKQAEEALRKSEEKLRAMFESITDGIVVTDLRGIITDVNDVTVHMSGVSREEIIGKDGFSLIPREDRDKLVGQGKKIVRGETGPLRMEHEVSPKVGSSSTTNLILGTMHDSAGNPTGFVAIAQDFTERKRAEEALRESEAKYRDLVESISDIIYSVDTNGVTTYISPVVESVLGYTPSELIGSSFADFMYQEDLKSATEGFMNNLSGNTTTGEFRVMTKSGEVRWVRSSNHPVFEEDRVIGVAGVLTDITERKRAEEERERLLAELEDKSKEMKQLLFVASHDLRSPLVNIQGFTREIEQSLQQVHSVLEGEDIPSAVKEKLAAPIEEGIADSLSYILASSSKIDTLLTGLLKLSRLGQAAITIEKLNMSDLMAEVVDGFEFQTKEAGVKLEVGKLPPCQGDKAQINQVFSNLIGNALKYLDPERPGVIRVSGIEEDSNVVYTVEDNGIGIAPEHQETVFEIFQRVGSSASSGEGLGLTIVRRILDRHGGKVWLESEPGRGSRFHISLPTGD